MGVWLICLEQIRTGEDWLWCISSLRLRNDHFVTVISFNFEIINTQNIAENTPITDSIKRRPALIKGLAFVTVDTITTTAMVILTSFVCSVFFNKKKKRLEKKISATKLAKLKLTLFK